MSKNGSEASHAQSEGMTYNDLSDNLKAVESDQTFLEKDITCNELWFLYLRSRNKTANKYVSPNSLQKKTPHTQTIKSKFKAIQGWYVC